MSTRMSLTIVDGGNAYKIYRHSDGYPEGFLADLKIFMDNYSTKPTVDAEYFLSNFIFYCKLSQLEEMRRRNKLHNRVWELGYGVCSPKCSHGDVKYYYVVYPDGDVDGIEIWKYSFDTKEFSKIYDGDLNTAFEKYIIPDFRDGCHLSKSVFVALKLSE